MKTYAPSATKRCAVARPIPLLPPVMTATFPFSLLMRFLLFDSPFTCDDSALVRGRAGMREMVRATGEGAWNNDGGLDSPPSQFTRVDDGQCIHPGLGREVRRQIGWRSARGAATRHPNYKTPSLLAQLRQCRTVHSLRA